MDDEKFDLSLMVYRLMQTQCEHLFDQMTCFAALRKNVDQETKEKDNTKIASLRQQVSENLDYLSEDVDITMDDLPYCEPAFLNESLVKFWNHTKEEYTFNSPIKMGENKKRYAHIVPLVESKLIKSEEKTAAPFGSTLPLKMEDPDFMKVSVDNIETIMDKLNLNADSLDCVLNFELGTVSKYLQGEPPTDDHNKLLYMVLYHIPEFKNWLKSMPRV